MSIIDPLEPSSELDALLDRSFGALGRLLSWSTSDERRRAMLVFDVAHSARSIFASGHEQIIVQRDLGGFFDQVFTLHPMLGANPEDRSASFEGPRRTIPIAPRHVIIENKALASSVAGLRPLAFALSQLGALAYACRLVEREKISVIRAADPFVTGLYAYLVARLTGRPFSLRIGANYDALARNGIITYPRLFASYGPQRALGSFVLSRCDLVLAANRNYRAYCIENGAREDRVVVVPYGNLLDPVHFTEPDQRGSLPEDIPCAGRPFAIVVGRLIDVKYPEDVLLVANEVRRHVPDVAILFVGEGDLRKHLEQRSEELGLQNTVYFMGLRNQEWLSRTYPHASAYLSPLTGRSLAEAALARLPLVAYDTDWHSEIVETGVTGELVPFRDWQAMAAALTRILTDAEYGLAVGHGARERSLDMMDQTRIREVERCAYERVLEAR